MHFEKEVGAGDDLCQDVDDDKARPWRELDALGKVFEPRRLGDFIREILVLSLHSRGRRSAADENLTWLVLLLEHGLTRCKHVSEGGVSCRLGQVGTLSGARVHRA